MLISEKMCPTFILLSSIIAPILNFMGVKIQLGPISPALNLSIIEINKLFTVNLIVRANQQSDKNLN